MDAAAPSPWPGWLRRHTGVEHLGPPGRFFAWLTIVLAFVLIVYVGGWNAAHYPVALGYDAAPNAQYMHVLLDQHHLPTPQQSGEANQPPAYYFVAEVAARAGHELFGWLDTRGAPGFPEASYRGAQVLNVVLVVLTALCLLWLARLVAPGRPWVWAAAVGFFAFLPVVSKTEAMIHPENLNMLCGTAALASATAILTRRRLTLWPGVVLVASIALGFATRASTLFVLVAVVLGAVYALGSGLLRRRRLRVAAAILVATAISVTAVVGYLQLRHHGVDWQTSRSQFFDVSWTQMFRAPWRSNFKNQALPETYVDAWGDWFSAFSWSVYDNVPSPPAQRILQNQSIIGLVPTVVALGGVIGVGWLALRRRKELAVVALLPPVALAGYLIRSWVALTKDGDLFKPAYLLNSAAAWALCFAFAATWLASRSRLLAVGLVVLFSVFAVLELRFTLYGIRDGIPIF